MRRLQEWRVFWNEFRGEFRTTGAVLPSGRFLAKEITRYCDHAPEPARILEAGPGTGAFTHACINHLRPGDRLDLVELNERFVGVLRHRLETNPAWSAKRDQVRVIHDSIQALPVGQTYHSIVCGLPFNNFEPTLVAELLGGLVERLEPGGVLSFFEYLWLRTLKGAFVGVEERRRLDAIAQTLDEIVGTRRLASNRVLINVPPAVVHHVRRPPTRSAPQT